MIFHCVFSGGRDGKHLATNGKDGLQLLVDRVNESKVLSIFSPKLLKSSQLKHEGQPSVNVLSSSTRIDSPYG